MPAISVTPAVNAENSGQPSARLNGARVNVTGVASYVQGGEDISAALPGYKIQTCPFVPTWDGAELRWARIEDDAGVAKLLFYDNDNGAPGAETTAADDVSGHATFDIDVTFV